ncbi:hypothetical protein [Archangium primigenium]|uniref:hypothetical protein n=1 Tax=[Archangium] primigenium TaxID=2792470 RepID=UPI001958C74B|nr:hypothetical protein [Archangium primigenium]MBM7115247.1 hypothetical protein [Archangium primigenium]
MGTFKQFLDEQKLEPSTLVRLSSQVEARDDADRTLSRQRADTRRDKERQGKAYEGIAKPRSGRGVSAQQVGAAIADEPLSPKVRGKLVRAVNAALAKKGGAAVTFPALFGEVKASKGPTAKKAS